MEQGDRLDKNFSSADHGDAGRRAENGPAWDWWVLWTLVMFLVFPAATIAMTPLSGFFVWSGYGLEVLRGAGFIVSFAFFMALFQRALLARWLPQAGRWFWATLFGALAGGAAAGLELAWAAAAGWDLVLARAAGFALFGLVLGLAQWRVLRWVVPNAGWLIFFDLVAAAVLMPAGRLLWLLMDLGLYLMLPGLISGLGMWLLLRQEGALRPEPASGRRIDFRLRPARVLLGVLVLVPLFFGCSYVYAVSQLAAARQGGVYPTIEQAIIEMNTGGTWGGARVVRIEDIQTGLNDPDGSHPHVGFGLARLYYDRVPDEFYKDNVSIGSYYLHIREGWVLVPEGAFPEFIGWVMELYNLEGVE